MIVLIDTNVLLSYLIAGKYPSAVVLVMQHIYDGTVRLVFPGKVEEELRRVSAEKPFFVERLSNSAVESYVRRLQDISERPVRHPGPARSVVRDPNDDYLIRVATGANVDYLITGDKDLLVLPYGATPF